MGLLLATPFFIMKKLYLKILHAVVGIVYSFKTQSSIKYLCVINTIVLILNIYLKKVEISIIFIALTFSAEMFNTAIELICDFIHPELHPKIKLIKDVSAGAVFAICISYFIIEIIQVVHYLNILPSQTLQKL